MRYLLMLSLAALFLIACGDTDNPVVTTAPAGKTTVDLSEEECQAATSLPESFLEKARELNPDLDEDLLLSTWKSHGCDDAVLWGLSWMVTKEAEVTFEVVIYTPPPEDEPEIAAHTLEDDQGNPLPNQIHTQSEIDRYHGRATSWISSGSKIASPKNHDRFDDLRKAGVLPTVSVSPTCRRGDIAVFTFSRTGPTDEHLTFAFGASQGLVGRTPGSSGFTSMSGFRAGESTTQWVWKETGLNIPDPVSSVGVQLTPGWHNDMTDDYQIGTSAAEVTSATAACP